MRKSDPIRALQMIARQWPMTVCDVGARHGQKSDLEAISEGVAYVLFEPDPSEAEVLRKGDTGKYGSVRVIETALADNQGSFTLNLYEQKGCSSGLNVNRDNAALFGREHYYNPAGTIEVPSDTVDRLVEKGELTAPAFMKVDVQGMEPEVLQGGAKCLEASLIGARIEVGFYPLYSGQPMASQLDTMMRSSGFVPMSCPEFHEWRRVTRGKYPVLSPGAVPFSRGQMMHADVLYLREPERMQCDDGAGLERLVHLGLIACCYLHFDHSIAALSRDDVRRAVIERSGVDPIDVVSSISKRYARRDWVSRMLRRAIRRLDGNSTTLSP